jgi:hypothetical protein
VGFLNIPWFDDGATQLHSCSVISGPCRLERVPAPLDYSRMTQLMAGLNGEQQQQQKSWLGHWGWVAVSPLPSPTATTVIIHTATPAPGCNVRSVDNRTLVPTLLRDAGVRTAQPLLVRITTNVTLGPGLNSSIPIRRPVLLMGLASAVTSVDFGMVVSQLNVTTPGAQLAWQRCGGEVAVCADGGWRGSSQRVSGGGGAGVVARAPVVLSIPRSNPCLFCRVLPAA